MRKETEDIFDSCLKALMQLLEEVLRDTKFGTAQEVRKTITDICAAKRHLQEAALPYDNKAIVALLGEWKELEFTDAPWAKEKYDSLINRTNAVLAQSVPVST